MFGGRSSILGNTPPVVKNLIYINVIMFLASWVLAKQWQIDLPDLLGAHYYQSPHFRPYQLITYMFMHSMTDPTHILFNMYGLWMFGRILESVWGGKRFFIYYFVTGIGAIIINMVVQHFEFVHIQNLIQNYDMHPDYGSFTTLINKYVSYPSDYLKSFLNKFQYNSNDLNTLSESKDILRNLYFELMDTPTIGASGAIFGVLLAFGMLFPNTELILLIPPIPIKAKWFVMGYGAIELYLGLSQPGSNIAHFAHLGGMLFGFILLKYWSHKRTNFY